MKLLFPHGTQPEEHKFVAYNMHTGSELVVMSDCKVSKTGKTLLFLLHLADVQSCVLIIRFRERLFFS